MNLPDDYGMGWTRCRKGHRFHMSDGGCDVCIDAAMREREINMKDMVAVRYVNGEFLFSKEYSPDAVLMIEGQIGMPLLTDNKDGTFDFQGISLYNSIEQAEEMLQYATYEQEKIVLIAPKM